jgi:hypothetical protein
MRKLPSLVTQKGHRTIKPIIVTQTDLICILSTKSWTTCRGFQSKKISLAQLISPNHSCVLYTTHTEHVHNAEQRGEIWPTISMDSETSDPGSCLAAAHFCYKVPPWGPATLQQHACSGPQASLPSRDSTVIKAWDRSRATCLGDVL